MYLMTKCDKSGIKAVYNYQNEDYGIHGIVATFWAKQNDTF